MALGARGCPLGQEVEACSTRCCGNPSNCRYVARAGGPTYKPSDTDSPKFDPWNPGPADRDTE